MSESPPRLKPNPEQAAAVALTEGPLRIMAGAGTGKTSTLTERIVAIVRDGKARPNQILALTFTNKAADEMRVRIERELVGNAVGAGQRVDVDTYHAFGGRIVSEFGDRIGLPSEPLVLTPAESWILLWRGLDEITFRYIDLLHIRGTGYGGGKLNQILELGSRLNDELRSLDDLARWIDDQPPDDENALMLRDFLDVLWMYQRRKMEVGAIDYGDQIALACALLGIEEIAERIRGRYRYILVDEYQDTNYAQSVMVSRLAGSPAANVCVVGDPNQAIYAFRGASPDNLDRFSEADFPPAKTVALKQNFRSTQQILDVANAIWGPEPAPFRGNLVSGRAAVGPLPTLVTAEFVADELAFIGDEIERQHAAGREFGDFAVIVRKNAMKATVYRALRDRRIPCQAVGGSSLFETAEVRELISYLRAICDPRDDPSIAHVLSAEPWGFDEAQLYWLAQKRDGRESLIETVARVSSEPDSPAILTAFRETLDRVTTSSFEHSLGRLVDQIIGLRKGGYDRLELENVRAFSAIVREFAASRVGEKPSLIDLIAYLDLLLDAGAEEEAASEIGSNDSDSVKVLTAHASKGLEWPVVFVAGANANDFRIPTKKGVLPVDLARSVPQLPEEEELRVLYVALTRAEEQLWITWGKINPERVRPRKLLPALEPAVELCESIQAPPAPDEAARTISFREIAPGLLSPIVSLMQLDSVEPAELANALMPRWTAAGGAPSVAIEAARRFAVERASLHEQINLIESLNARNAEESEGESRAVHEFSYTQLDAFETCPHRYFLKYRIELPGAPSNRTTRVGSAVHNAIARAARSSVPVNRERLETLYREDPGLVPGDATIPASQTSAGSSREMFENFMAAPDATAEVLLTEQNFVLPIGAISVRGVIDRVQRVSDGSTEVVDFKTDQTPRSREAVRAGWQLPLYLIATRRVFTNVQPAPARAVMFFLRSNQRIEIEYGEEELAARETEMNKPRRGFRR